MMEFVPPPVARPLRDYSAFAHLAPAVRQLEEEARSVSAVLEGRTIWMVNSTARGGGVAEMLPRMIALLKDLGIRTEWAVLATDEPDFFRLTKNLHNLIHGAGTPRISASDRTLYERVNEENAKQLLPRLRKGDIVIIHDPQPMAMARTLREALDVHLLWRCHIGLDRKTPETKAAWSFLEPWCQDYEHAVFSATEYIPDCFAGRAAVIHPAIDPLSHKNRPLSPNKLTGVLCNAGVMPSHQPVLTPPFPHQVKRLGPSGEFTPVLQGEDLGVLFRPIVLQVSRWDRLKGFAPLLRGFRHLKEKMQHRAELDHRHRRRLDIVRLVLAGPDPEAVKDDPEGQEVLQELIELYRALPSGVQRDVALLSLPMESAKENALIVNALQNLADLVVQNSLQEGFGLTATEALWKGKAVLASDACGLMQQIRDGIDGRINPSPEDPEAIAAVLDEMLENDQGRRVWGRSAQRRVYDEFLVFTQLRHWLRLMANCARRKCR